MTVQAGTSPSPLSTQQLICNAFVQQYYQIIHMTPDLAHKFYQDGSSLGRANSDGVMEYVTTLPEISRKIMSMDFSNYLTEIETADALLSHRDGVLIVVTGSLTMSDEDRRRFTQTFFLAPQESGGYFVLTDILRLMTERTSDEVNQENEGNQNDRSVAKSDPTPVAVGECLITDHEVVQNNFADGEVINPTVKGTTVKDSPTVNGTTVKDSPTVNGTTVKDTPTVNGTTVKDSPTVNGTTVKDSPTVNGTHVANNATVEPPMQVTKKGVAASSSPAQKDVTKQSYASIVKVMKEGPSTPVVKPKQAPKPVTKAVEGPDKSFAKPPQTGETSPFDKSATQNNTSLDEQGYSVFIKSLPFNTTVKMVEEEFNKFGAIKASGIQVRNKTDGFCFGFVEFESHQSMQAAIEASPIQFGEKQVSIEEKRTTTRVVNGLVVINAGGGGSFQSGRGAYRGNSRGRGGGYVNNANYRGGNAFRRRNNVDSFNRRNDGVNFDNRKDGDNFKHRNYGGNLNSRNDGDNFSRSNEFRNQNEFSGQGREPPQGNGYHHNENGFHQPRPFQKENQRFARVKTPKQTPVAA